MTFPRRRFLQIATSAMVLPRVSGNVWSQTYPSKPVRIILGLAPGGSVDSVTRLMAQWLSERFGLPFIVENRPGAAGSIATEVVAHSLADGYTLLVVLA